jgi:Glycosyltransferase family 87
MVGLVLLTISWALLHLGFWGRNEIIDTPVYQNYGKHILDGDVPYRDFALEYPPAALPMFVLPAFANETDYKSAFELLMWTCGIAALVLVGSTLARVGASSARLFAASAFVGVTPLILGSVVLTRYDLWPAALVVGALAALVAGRDRLALAVLGLAVAAKLYPAVLLPVALIWIARRRGRREAALALAAFTAVLVAVFLPFVTLSPGGVWHSLTAQFGRPLQIESLGAAVLLAAHQLGAYDPTIVSSHGSQNLAGPLPDALAMLQTVLQALAVAITWGLFARGRPDRERLLTASAAAVVAFVAFGKVLSPQFLIWLLPLVPLVAGGAGVTACWVLAATLIATQLWFPYRYWDVVALEPAGWLVLARDLLLLVLLGVLLTATARGRGLPRSA